MARTKKQEPKKSLAGKIREMSNEQIVARIDELKHNYSTYASKHLLENLKKLLT